MASVVITRDDIGYYDNPNGPPKYEPGIRPCLLCGEPWSDGDVRTYSIRRDNALSLFWRAHKSCAVAASDQDITAVDLAVFAVMGVPGGSVQ